MSQKCWTYLWFNWFLSKLEHCIMTRAFEYLKFIFITWCVNKPADKMIICLPWNLKRSVVSFFFWAKSWHCGRLAVSYTTSPSAPVCLARGGGGGSPSFLMLQVVKKNSIHRHIFIVIFRIYSLLFYSYL